MFDDGGKIISTGSTTSFSVGTIVFATVVLTIDGMEVDSLKEEYYTL